MFLDAFKTHSLVFQIQYKEAFSLWDRAGEIAAAMKRIWPDLGVQDGTPNQQILSGNGYQINTGLTQSTITLRSEQVLQSQALKSVSEAFEVWRSGLELIELTRISARVVFAKDFPEISDAREFLLGLDLIRWPEQKVFDQPIDSSRNVPELTFRFEDEKSFAFVRIRSERKTIKLNVDPDIMEAPIEKRICRVLVDFDRGNIGSIPLSKLQIPEWFKGYVHVLRRDIDKVLGRPA
ncbi:hypothetical protein [Frateuria terrea]|uniref:TIGR04255 family protein n=1 Tax=Frateuria terrea TaxID=529704 RepID=A0A1H6QP59_9GAMM|nr:hypothetical protein [Frateuria terrea]SEI45598.1 hypothetical protein SAMN04487997_0757 [Frateuria terrea]SFP11378.1 hypothetical protein SAMN02927913_0672 [Frateuria terrea]